MVAGPDYGSLENNAGAAFFYVRFQVLENERIFSYWEMIAHTVRGLQ